MKDFRAAARARIHAGGFHSLQSFFDGELRDAREVMHFDHRKSFEMYVRMALFQAANQFQEIFEWKIRMQAAHDMKFRRALTDAFVGALIDFLECVSVRAGRVRIATEGTELAVCNADIRRVNVAVDVVIRDIAVFFFADVVGEPPYSEQIRRAVKLDAIVKWEAFAR